MMNIPDAPDISRTLETGYPDEQNSERCDRCGGYFDDDLCFLLDGQHICKECFIETMQDDIRSDPKMFAETFGIPYEEVCG